MSEVNRLQTWEIIRDYNSALADTSEVEWVLASEFDQVVDERDLLKQKLEIHEDGLEKMRIHANKLEEERDDLKRLWQSVAERVMPGEQDTVETVLAMLREREELREALAEHERDGLLVYGRKIDLLKKRIRELEKTNG